MYSVGLGYPIQLQPAIASILDSVIANTTLILDLKNFTSSTRDAVTVYMSPDNGAGGGNTAVSLWLQGTRMYNNTHWRDADEFAARARSTAVQLASVGEVWTDSSAALVFSNVVGLRKFIYPFGTTPLEILLPGGQEYAAPAFPTENDAAFKQLVEVRRRPACSAAQCGARSALWTALMACMA
jgi:hypothetical protein